MQASQKNKMILVLAIAYTAVVAWLLCVPGKSLPKGPDIPHADKYVHFGLFGLLCMLWMRYWQNAAATRNKSVWLLMLLLSGYGLLLEWIQLKFAVGRSFSWVDWVADTVGILLAWLIYSRFSSSSKIMAT